MNTEAEIEARFWKSLKGDRVGMLGLTVEAYPDGKLEAT